MYRYLYGWWLVVAALLVTFAKAVPAQLGAQITANSATGSRSFSTGQVQIDATSAMHGTGLTAVPEGFAKLKLAPGFLLELNVLDDADFAGTFRIDQQGDLALPILGTVHIAGDTISEARIAIRQKLLEDQILRDPQINLTVLEYAAPNVTILGEVATPGTYPLLAPRPLVDVLALAGGTTLTAGTEVEILPAGADSKPIVIPYSNSANAQGIRDTIVDPGDTVQVKRAGIVYVLGAVNRPGGYVMQESGTLNVLQALALANGTSLTAKTSAMHILRKNKDGTVSDIPVSYAKLVRGRGANLQLYPRDVLYVPVNKIRSILTSSTAILSSAASASIYVAAE